MAIIIIISTINKIIYTHNFKWVQITHNCLLYTKHLQILMFNSFHSQYHLPSIAQKL